MPKGERGEKHVETEKEEEEKNKAGDYFEDEKVKVKEQWEIFWFLASEETVKKYFTFTEAF